MRVLIIEDDPHTASSIELALAAEGIVCDKVERGEEGLEISMTRNWLLPESPT